jgi:hypothetical protein
MAWIESHQEIGQHPKTRKAARLAGTTVPTMVGHLHLVWHWAMDFAQEGDISRFEPWQIEDAAMWDGDEGKLYAALIESGYVDAIKDGGVVLHDWHDYAGKLIERRRADAERKRRDSAKNPPPSPPKPDGIQRNSDGTPTEGGTESIRNRNLNRTSTVTVPEPDSAESGEGVAPAKPKPPRKQPETFCPESFPLEDKHLTYAASKGLTAEQAEQETEKFLLWHGARQTKYADWYKAWQSWILRSLNDHPKVRQFTGNGNGRPAVETFNGSPIYDHRGNPTPSFFAKQAHDWEQEDNAKGASA